jgi:NAD(P)-dependent dehydrogenase (short-subunit alcohol dehydrogenase family)
MGNPGRKAEMSAFLKDKIAVVTGASRGLGRAIAVALAAEGVRVALAGRDEARLAETAAAARERGGEAVPFKVDVTSEEQVLAFEREVRSRLGPARILVNNAGVNLRKPVTAFTLGEWRWVLDSNLTSAFLMCRSFVPHMQGTGYGRILNLTSIMSHVSLPGRAAYSASKAGLLGLTRALAMELADGGVTVVGISPGPVATEINAEILNDPAVNAQFLARIPVGRWGRPEDIGSLAVYLCSEEAAFITGGDVIIDGGWLAQ